MICPDCKRLLKPKATRCACGYFPSPAPPKPKASRKAMPFDHRPVREKCPDCTRVLIGSSCRCGYERPRPPATAETVYKFDPAAIESFQRVGRPAIDAALQLLKEGTRHVDR